MVDDQRRVESRFVDSHDPAGAGESEEAVQVLDKVPAIGRYDLLRRASREYPKVWGHKRLKGFGKFQPCGSVFAVMH